MARIPDIPDGALEERFLRASGPGGQNVKTFCPIAAARRW